MDRQEHVLWCRGPADQWLEALPVGNGQLGGMLFGGHTTELVDLSVDTIWSGPSVDRTIVDPQRGTTTSCGQDGFRALHLVANHSEWTVLLQPALPLINRHHLPTVLSRHATSVSSLVGLEAGLGGHHESDAGHARRGWFAALVPTYT